MYLQKAALAILFILITANSHADEYTYIDYAIGIISPKNSSSNGDYSSFSASFDIKKNAFITLDKAYYEDTPQYDYDISKFGVGAYIGIGVVTDVYGLVQLVKADLDNQDDTGLRATVGLRTSISKTIELAAKIKHEAVYEDTSDTYGLEMRYYLTPLFSAGIAYEEENISNTEIDIFYGSLRLKF